MTIMKVIVPAALAVFIVVFIVLILMWKREAKRRTASIEVIEKKLNEVVGQLADSNRLMSETNNDDVDRKIESMLEMFKQINLKEHEHTTEETIQYGEEISEDEISFDFLDSYDYDLEDMAYDVFEEEDIGLPNEYITGRSGRKYTAEELEALIQE